MKYKPKDVVIEAERFFHDEPLPFRDKGPYVAMEPGGGFYVITAHAQRAYLADGDYVVLEPVGPLVPAFAAYPVKPEIFESRWQLATEQGRKEKP